MERIKPVRHGEERTMLRAMLNFQRAEFLSKLDGLETTELRLSLPPSDLTLAGLTKHLALVEDSWYQNRFAGEPLVEPWASAPFDDDFDWEFHSAVVDSGEQLRTLYTAAIERSNAIYDAAESLDQLNHSGGDVEPFSLRWVTLHMIEETARHAGHADLIRQSIDGSTSD